MKTVTILSTALMTLVALGVSAKGKPTHGHSPQNKPFVSKRVEVTSQFKLMKPASKVFPLYGPDEERKWAPGWNPQWIYPGKNKVLGKTPQKNWIFRLSHGHSQPQIWTIREYDSKKRVVEYSVFIPNLTVHTIRVEVKADSPTSSTTKVTYIYTGLSKKGNKTVASKKQKSFEKEIKLWKAFIKYYFATGKTHPPVSHH